MSIDGKVKRSRQEKEGSGLKKRLKNREGR
jgi:hypothetical protein